MLPNCIQQTKSVVFRHLGMGKMPPFWQDQTGRGEENVSELFQQSGCPAQNVCRFSLKFQPFRFDLFNHNFQLIEPGWMVSANIGLRIMPVQL